MNSSKGQMEIIGLVIIVILISLGMLFLVRFELTDSSSKTNVRSERLPYSTMSSLMKVTVAELDCVPGHVGNSLLSFEKNLITDCAINVGSSPSGYSDYQCAGKHSCIFVHDTASSLLEQTLGAWHMKYTLSSELITFEGQTTTPLFTEINSSRGGCPAGKPREASIFPIRTDAGLVHTVLYVCN